MTPMAYRVPDATVASGIARTRLYELMKEGKLVAVKDGRRTLILADSLKAYLESLRQLHARAA
jgi:excisionase family DNA binding protein